MARVLHKTTLQYLPVAHTPNYQDGNWLINPVLPECEQKYWKINGDQVIEMTATEKNEVDVENAEQAEEAQKETLIANKQQEISRAEAIQALKDDGVLDSNGDLIGG